MLGTQAKGPPWQAAPMANFIFPVQTSPPSKPPNFKRDLCAVGLPSVIGGCGARALGVGVAAMNHVAD